MSMGSQVSENDVKPYPVYDHPAGQLDFSSVQQVPESHAWTSSFKDESHLSSHFGGGGDQTIIPVVDLSDVNVPEVLGRACTTWGVFQVMNHGIPASLLKELESFSHKLFSLPMQQKLKASRSVLVAPVLSGFGTTPNSSSFPRGYGTAPISSFFPKVMWSEGFTIVGSPLEHARLLWPQDYTPFCEVIEEFEKEMKKLAVNLMGMILRSLGIHEGDIEWANPKNASAAIQLNSYPACPEPDRAMGLGAHTDSTILTILHQNDTSGLQVHREETGWVTVPPLPGALVVNVGDLLHILSNGVIPSVVHRVVVNRTRHRLSIAFLYGPPSDVNVSPIEKLIDKSHPPLYRPVSWSKYLEVKSKIFDKALPSLRLSAPPDADDGINESNAQNSLRAIA